MNDIVGICGRCGGEEFLDPFTAPMKAVTPLTCASCGTRTTYGDLRVQIAAEAVNQSRHTLRVVKEAMDQRRHRRRGP